MTVSKWEFIGGGRGIAECILGQGCRFRGPPCVSPSQPLPYHVTILGIIGVPKAPNLLLVLDPLRESLCCFSRWISKAVGTHT